MSKANDAKKEMLKMLIDNDGYMDKLKKSRSKSKERVDKDKKKNKQYEVPENHADFIHELNEVGPDLKKGIKREYKKVKDMFKKKK